ncbi:50S ribosomal protein L3 [Patescibacteria group bacterium]|nr:50S ribosomal protein L3 [Patescibacteria group bacterium]
MKCIIGKKLDMTQVFGKDGNVVPVTRVQAGPCVITQMKTKEKDGVQSVQVGFDKQKLFRIKSPQKGHLKDIKWDNNTTVRFMKDFKVEDSCKLEKGHIINVSMFSPGEKVQVVGTSKGRGFQGVVKRHGFHGSPASHGHKDQLRMPGSIGATDPARVFKGTRMGGHMGDERVTIKNLEIIDVKSEENILFIKGAVPGARGGILLVSTNESSFEIENLENMLKTNTENTEKKEYTENIPTQGLDRQEMIENADEVVEVIEEVVESEPIDVKSEEIGEVK